MKTSINFMLILFLLIAFGISCDEKENPEQEENETFIDPRDGQEYPLVNIGIHTWTAVNLNYKGPSGDLGWVYRDDNSYEEKYGRMYNWDMTSQVCPDGWKLPTKEQYTYLINQIGNAEGVVIDEKFNLIAGGLRQNNQGQYDDKTEYQTIDNEGFFWSASEDFNSMVDNNGNHISSFLLYYNAAENNIGLFGLNKEHGFSVRCVKDN